MWLEDDTGRAWWQPEGTQQVSDPPYALREDEYEDDQRDWESRLDMLAPALDNEEALCSSTIEP